MGKKDLPLQIIFYIILLSLVILLFLRFTHQNSTRIQEQNAVYATDAARQNARRIEIQFKSALELIRAYAYFLNYTGGSSNITASLLKKLELASPFDAIRYTAANGMNYSSQGHVTDARNRSYYMEGMKGKSGISVVFNPQIFTQTILVFYAPLRVDGKITGVLHGEYLAEKYLRDMLDTTYFDTHSQIFLCDPSGMIIANSDGSRTIGHIVQVLYKKDVICEKTAREAIQAFNERKSATFNCGSNSSTDIVCVVHIPEFNFMLVQLFPRSVSNAMTEKANFAGVQLEFSLLFLFAVYAAFLLLRWHMQKRGLERENREFGTIIKGMDTLFESMYCTLDVADKSYSYLSGYERKDQSLKTKGDFSTLLKYHTENIIGSEAKKDFANFFTLDNLVKTMANTDYVTYECHVERNGREDWENLATICLERDSAGKACKLLFVRQNVTEMKLRELGAQKQISDMGRKERQYRIAVVSSALFSYEFNVTRDLLEMDITQQIDGKTVSLLAARGIAAPCKASEAFASWRDNVLPESQPDYEGFTSMDYLRQRHDSGKHEADLDFWVRNLENEEICMRLSFYLTQDDMSGDIMAMAVAKDITAQVNRQRQQTRDLQDALMQAQHANAAKTTFLSNMSHDIRTPMNAIIGFTTIAATHLDNRVQVRDCLQKVLSSSNHLLSLINDILDMSRIESGKMQIKNQECNISELMHNLVSIIQPQVKAKQLQLFIDTFDVVNEDVITDPLKINQVFINLLSNAVKYTAAGGKIIFSIHQKAAFRHGHADYVFEVRDNGIGMSEEFVRHIFEPFTRETTTTLSGIQGTGLGMAITRNIVEMMGGNISVESEPGTGSLFTVSLTMRIQDKERENDAIGELSGLRALVIDDDFHVCDSVDKMLKKIGMRSEWTTSGREAVYRAQIARDDGDPYNTYIVDWQMPDMNGVETARRIRQIAGDDAPIIILTAYEWTDIEDEAREAGVTAFCAKPLFMSDLRNALLTSHNMQGEDEKIIDDGTDFSGKRILVVDDVEMNREIAEFILSEGGFVVEIASDGTDAVEMVRNSAEGWYDAILMDVQMPVMNGYEATRAIRGLRRKDVCGMPIIAMTANALEEDKSEALKSGMNAHIAKPIDIRVFFDVIKKFFQQGQ